MTAIDLRALAGGGSGIVWNQATEDLNLNLMVLDPGGEIAEHVNDAVDVLLIAVDGRGAVTIDGIESAIEVGQIALIPRGTRRSIRARTERLAYLLCHRRRSGLWPQPLHRPER